MGRISILKPFDRAAWYCRSYIVLKVLLFVVSMSAFNGLAIGQISCCRFDLPDEYRHQAALSLEYAGGRFYLFFDQSGPPFASAGSGLLVISENGIVGYYDHWTDVDSLFNSLGRNGVATTQDQGFIVPGNTTDNIGWSSLSVRRLNNSGQTMWARTYMNADFEQIGTMALEATDGSIVIVGHKVGLGLVHGMVWKLEPDGDLIWEQMYTGPLGHSLRSIDTHSAGGYLVTGTYNYNTCNSQAWLMYINEEGEELWSTVHGGPFRDGLGCVIGSPDGEALAIGGSRISCSSDMSQNWIARYDGAGALLWQNNIGQSGYRGFSSMKLIPDSSGVLMVGSNMVGSLYTGWICKYALNGDSIWCRSIPYDDGVLFGVHAAFYDLVPLEDGRIAVTGVVWTGTPSSGDIWFMMLDEDGQPIPDISVSAASVALDGSTDPVVRCHPNPTNGPVRCSMEDPHAGSSGSWTVLDMFGRPVLFQEKGYVFEMDIHSVGLSPGGYWVQYFSDRVGTVTSRILLIE